MKPLTDYIKRLERNLVGIEERKRKDIIRDLKVRVLEMSEEYGGGEEGIRKAIEGLDPPEKLAEKYVSIYGPKRADLLQMSFIAISISTFTLPVIPFTSLQNIFSLLVIPILALFIVFVGRECGMKIAAVPALVAAVWRSSIFQITLYLYPFEMEAAESGIYIVHITSLLLVLMVLAFPIPGRE